MKRVDLQEQRNERRGLVLVLVRCPTLRQPCFSWTPMFLWRQKIAYSLAQEQVGFDRSTTAVAGVPARLPRLSRIGAPLCCTFPSSGLLFLYCITLSANAHLSLTQVLFFFLPCPALIATRPRPINKH